MALKNQTLTITYLAWNTSTNQGATADAGNHTLRAVGDGTEFTPTNTPTEVDSTNLKGVYKLALLASEMNYNFVTLGGISSTTNVIINPLSIITERGVLPNVAPTNQGAPLTVGTGTGQANPDGTGALPVAFGTALPGSPTAGTVGESLKRADLIPSGGFPTNFSSLAISGGGNITVGGYAANEDPATILFAAALPGTPTAGTAGEALKFADTRLDAAVSSVAPAVWTQSSRTLTAFGFSVTVSGNVTVGGYASGQDPATLLASNFSSIAGNVWANGSRTLTAFGFSVTVSGNVTVGGYASGQDPVTLMNAGTPSGLSGTWGAIMVSLNSYSSLVIPGTVSDGSPTSSAFGTAGLSGTNGDYVGQSVCFTSGNLKGRKETIQSYTGGRITVATAFVTAPANGDTFEII